MKGKSAKTRTLAVIRTFEHSRFSREELGRGYEVLVPTTSRRVERGTATKTSATERIVATPGGA